MKNTPELRRQLSRSGKYVQTNPNAPPHKVSFHYNALAIDWINWEDLAEEKITATHAARHAALLPLKDYVQKRLAEAWDDSPRETDATQKNFLGGYALLEQWEDEFCRFMTIDCQAGKASQRETSHFWYVIRLWSATGESRLFDCGKIYTFEELEEKRKEHGVEPQRTLIDCAWETNIVHQRCLQYGWQGLWGKDQPHFPHHLANGETLRLPYSTVQRGHVGIGLSKKPQIVSYWYWSNPTVKDLFHHLKNGFGVPWTVARDAGADYLSHINAEYKRQEHDKRGRKIWRWYVSPKRDDHLLDCEQMNLLAACMAPQLPVGKSLLPQTPQQD